MKVLMLCLLICSGCSSISATVYVEHQIPEENFKSGAKLESVWHPSKYR